MRRFYTLGLKRTTMKLLVLVFALIGLSSADLYHHYSVVNPVVSSQYHSQDSLGQYSYGYSGGPSAKAEVKTFDGITRGGYSYVDGEGKVQTLNYVADPVYGFRVAGTNVPADTPEVAKAKAEHLAAVEVAKFKVVPNFKIGVVEVPEMVVGNQNHVAAVEAVKLTHVKAGSVVDTPEVAKAKAEHEVAVQVAKARNAVVSYPGLAYPYTTYAAAAAPVIGYSAFHHNPVNFVKSPVAYSSLVHSPVVSSQYHAQDAQGQYSYGYVGGPSSKSEMKTADGVTRGRYSYVDSDGKFQTVNYVADQLGFRVAGSNVPVDINKNVVDTPEVVSAKIAHFAAHQQAKARLHM